MSTSKGTILVVDDNKNNLDLMLVTLSDQNYRLLAATSGERALKIAQKVEPDLVLMDIQMPGMDGYETARRFKTDLNLNHVPILFLSALNDLNNIVQCFAAGGVDYISKPFKKEELLARVNTHLSIKKLQSKLRDERDRISTILHGILPEKVINKLKSGTMPEPEYISRSTVMFADFAGFTALIKEEGAQKGISYLNQLFDTFDDIANYYGLERIKTIGDAYMAVAGVNRKIEHPELATVLTALSIRSFLRAFNDRISKDRWKLRVGIHSGPVIAGIVGHQKIAYDVWGNTVNISSRLENISRVEAITISKNVQEKTEESLKLNDRGVHELHNWGNMNVFEVEDISENIPTDLKEKYEALNIQTFVDDQFSEPSSILNQLFDIS